MSKLRYNLIALTAIPVLCLFLGAAVHAQTPQFSINPGSFSTSTNTFPFNSTTQIQLNYTAGQFTGAYTGTITKVYFKRASANTATATYTNFTLKMAQIASSAFPSTTTYYSPMNTIYSGLLTVPPGSVDQWFAIQLPTPVSYDPNQALMFNACNTSISNGFTLRTYSATTPPYRRIYGGTCGATTGTSDAYLYACGIDMAPALPNDAGIAALLSPVSFCAGTFDIKVKLRNAGTNTLSNVSINWEYDDVPQAPISWTTPLPTQTEADVTLGSRNFAAGIAHRLKAWTSNPNGVPDTFNPNDTLYAELKPALSGVFTVGGSNPDYPTLKAARDDLYAVGVCGPVVFNIRSGTYDEQLALGSSASFITIPGVSATNTITFQSETGNRADVIITFASLTGNPTLYLNGADWITFRNLTVRATNPSYGIVVYILGGSEHCTFENLDLVSSVVSTTSTNNAVVYSPSGSLDHYTTFRGCNLIGGSYSMYMYGSSTSALEIGDVIEDNTMTDFYYQGMTFYYHDSPEFRRNLVRTASGYTGYGAYLYYNQNERIFTGNKIIFTGAGTKYGMYVYYNQATSTKQGLISNNFVSIGPASSAGYTLYQYYNTFQRVYNNTFWNAVTGSYYGAYVYYGNDIRFMNNIVYTYGPGYSYYVTPATAVTHSDYNLYYTNGATLAYWGSAAANLATLRTLNGKDMNSVSKPVIFANAPLGDLHLAGASQDDPDIRGTLLAEVPDDIDGEPRARPYIGADEGCYVTPGAVDFEMSDASGNPAPYFNFPGTAYVKYRIGFPDEAFSATVTINFYTIPGNNLAYTTNFAVNKLAGITLEGITAINVPTLPPGYYRVEAVFNTWNSCLAYTNYRPEEEAVLVVPQDQIPCVVWPGDANNDGIVNYGDRSALNKYIINANLSPAWLQGPARYRPDAATNPLTYYTWVGQPAVPWATALGCYMDTDGNGVVNSFDYLAMKLNWFRTHGIPKTQDAPAELCAFDLSQNYPNPFNPVTTLVYSIPENAHVRLVVTDMLGREVAVPAEGYRQSGVYRVQFDGSTLQSGNYTATLTMTGDEPGEAMVKSVKMTLAK